MLGGVGIVLAAIAFFSWRKSAKSWQRIVAWTAAVWAGISLVIILIGLAGGWG